MYHEGRFVVLGAEVILQVLLEEDAKSGARVLARSVVNGCPPVAAFETRVGALPKHKG